MQEIRCPVEVVAPIWARRFRIDLEYPLLVVKDKLTFRRRPFAFDWSTSYCNMLLHSGNPAGSNHESDVGLLLTPSARPAPMSWKPDARTIPAPMFSLYYYMGYEEWASLILESFKPSLIVIHGWVDCPALVLRCPSFLTPSGVEPYFFVSKVKSRHAHNAS